MTITIAARKAKARNLQKFIRDLILAYFPLLPDDVRSTGMGQSGVDLQLSPKAREYFNYDVECKHDENRSIWHCWKCTTDNTKKGKALLVMKKNHHEALAVLKVQDFFELLKELQQLKHNVQVLKTETN